MEVVKTKSEDIVEIDKIFDQAKAYLKSKGIDQWQNGYPNAQTVLEDIKTDTSYVLKDNNQVIGTMRFLIDVDVDYIDIDGKWLRIRRFCAGRKPAEMERI